MSGTTADAGAIDEASDNVAKTKSTSDTGSTTVTNSAEDTTEQRPTRLSTAVVVGLTLLVTGQLVTAVGLGQRATYGVVGAVALAAVLGLLASDRLEPIGVALVGPVLPVVSLAVVAGVGVTLVAQLRNALPVGSVFVVLGATVAVFGATLAVRDVLSHDALARAVAAGVRSTVVVAIAAVGALAIQFGPARTRAGPVLDDVVAWVFAPTAPVPLASFLALTVAVVYLSRTTIVALPISELLGERVGEPTRARLSRFDRALKLTAPVALTVVAAAVGVETVTTEPYGWLPGGLREFLGGLARAETIRILLVDAVVAEGLVVATVTGLKRAYRGSGRAALVGTLPYVSGALVVVAVLQYREPFVAAMIEEVERRLPIQLLDEFRRLSTQAIDLYGEAAIGLMVVTLLSGLTLVVVLALFVSSTLGVLTERASGAGLAGAGLCLVAAFASTLGASLLVALAGVVAAFVVWDTGTFGVTLGAELGDKASTVRTELVHGGATVLLGAGAAGVAIWLDRMTGPVTASGVPVVVALVGAIGGLLLLAVASR